MKLSKILLLITFVAVALFILFYLYLYQSRTLEQKESKQVTPQSTVSVGTNTVRVTLASSEEEKEKGLSGTTYLADDEGMLFEFNPKNLAIFWMKGMYLPLDIIWISDDKVIGCEEKIPAPEPGTDDSALKLYRPTEPVDYALEVNAGYCKANNVQIGDAVVVSIVDSN